MIDNASSAYIIKCVFIIIKCVFILLNNTGNVHSVSMMVLHYSAFND